MSSRLHAALQAKRVLEVIRTPRGPDPRALHDLEGAELEGLRETAVGRAFGVARAELSADGRFLRLHVADATCRIAQVSDLGEPAELTPDPPPPAVLAACAEEVPRYEPAALTPEERMAAIRSEPHWEIRAAMLALEVGHLNAMEER